MECPAHPPCEVPAAQSGLVPPSSGRSVVPGVHVVSGVGHHVIDLTKDLLDISWGSMHMSTGASLVRFRRWRSLWVVRQRGWEVRGSAYKLASWSGIFDNTRSDALPSGPTLQHSIPLREKSG